MNVPLPTFITVVMNIDFDEKDGKVVIPEFLWNFDAILCSAGFWYPHTLFEKKGKIMVDSAGFQFRGRANLHRRGEFLSLREKYYRWQCEYGDYIIGGDIPIGITKDIKFIKNTLELSLNNMQLQFDLGAEGRYVNVIHGREPEIIRYWYSGVKKFPSIGWAFGSALKTSVYGFALQLIALYELGAFKQKQKIIHCLGATSRKVAVGMHYLVEKLGIETEMLSFDASSSSAHRFGMLIDENGDGLSFKDVREGRPFFLWNGEKLVDIPAKLGGERLYHVMRTNMENAVNAWKKNVQRVVREKGEEYDSLVVSSGAKFVYDTWKELGVDGLCKEIDRRGLMGRVSAIEAIDSCRIL